MSKRKLGDPAPDNLIIKDGEILMKDGSCVRSYLNAWQTNSNILNGEQVCVVPKYDLERLERKVRDLIAFTFC